jgi:hypothetical protein
VPRPALDAAADSPQGRSARSTVPPGAPRLPLSGSLLRKNTGDHKFRECRHSTEFDAAGFSLAVGPASLSLAAFWRYRGRDSHGHEVATAKAN